MALPWTLFLVLLDFYAERAHAWCSLEDELYIDEPVSDPDIVKFALSAFHKQSKDEYAYRSIHVMHFSKVQGKLPETFFMKLRLRRTICKTSEDSLDTCPFQDSPELKNLPTLKTVQRGENDLLLDAFLTGIQHEDLPAALVQACSFI